MLEGCYSRSGQYVLSRHGLDLLKPLVFDTGAEALKNRRTLLARTDMSIYHCANLAVAHHARDSASAAGRSPVRHGMVITVDYEFTNEISTSDPSQSPRGRGRSRTEQSSHKRKKTTDPDEVLFARQETRECIVPPPPYGPSLSDAASALRLGKLT